MMITRDTCRWYGFLHSKPVQLTVLGSNGTYPTPNRPGSGYLVTAGNTAVVLDLGPGAFAALLDTGRTPDAVVLTHGHSDHCVDALALLNYLRFERSDLWGVPLFAPEGVVARLAAFVDAGPDHDFFRVFQPHDAVPGTPIAVGEMQIEFGPVVHPVPAVSVRVRGRTRSLVYTGDTGPCPELAGFASGAEILLCEATYQGTPPQHRYPFHLYASEAGALARDARAHALIVTHVAPTLDPEVSVAEAAAVFGGPVRHAEPGLEVGL